VPGRSRAGEQPGRGHRGGGSRACRLPATCGPARPRPVSLRASPEPTKPPPVAVGGRERYIGGSGFSRRARGGLRLTPHPTPRALLPWTILKIVRHNDDRLRCQSHPCRHRRSHISKTKTHQRASVAVAASAREASLGFAGVSCPFPVRKKGVGCWEQKTDREREVPCLARREWGCSARCRCHAHDARGRSSASHESRPAPRPRVAERTPESRKKGTSNTQNTKEAERAGCCCPPLAC
jgi:hypothetical protein